VGVEIGQFTAGEIRAERSVEEQLPGCPDLEVGNSYFSPLFPQACRLVECKPGICEENGGPRRSVHGAETASQPFYQ
jgi:hypothetical protein